MAEIKDILSQQNISYLDRYDFVEDINDVLSSDSQVKVDSEVLKKFLHNELFCGFIIANDFEEVVYNKVFDVEPTRCLLVIKHGRKFNYKKTEEHINQFKDKFNNVLMLISIIENKKMKTNMIKAFFFSDIK